jgi:hypothetical protein
MLGLRFEASGLGVLDQLFECHVVVFADSHARRVVVELVRGDAVVAEDVAWNLPFEGRHLVHEDSNLGEISGRPERCRQPELGLAVLENHCVVQLARPRPRNCVIHLLAERLALRLDAEKFFEIREGFVAGFGGVVSEGLYGERVAAERRGPGVGEKRHQVFDVRGVS